MGIPGKYSFCLLMLSAAMLGISKGRLSAGEGEVPRFGRDTVLVWENRHQGETSSFIVRIAEFFPDRFIEWEDAKTQGTIFIPNRELLSAKAFVSANLFDPGVDTRGKNTTTLWLSRQVYVDLKEKKRAKLKIDGLDGWITYQGTDRLSVAVNRLPTVLSVIKASDNRGSERWFLDDEENPLMVKHLVRKYSQVLASITTDRPNTLRWIKGKKLANLPR